MPSALLWVAMRTLAKALAAQQSWKLLLSAAPARKFGKTVGGWSRVPGLPRISNIYGIPRQRSSNSFDHVMTFRVIIPKTFESLVSTKTQQLEQKLSRHLYQLPIFWQITRFSGFPHGFGTDTLASCCDRRTSAPLGSARPGAAIAAAGRPRGRRGGGGGSWHGAPGEFPGFAFISEL